MLHETGEPRRILRIRDCIEINLNLQAKNTKFQGYTVDDTGDKRRDLYMQYFCIYFTISEKGRRGGTGIR